MAGPPDPTSYVKPDLRDGPVFQDQTFSDNFDFSLSGPDFTCPGAFFPVTCRGRLMPFSRTEDPLTLFQTGSLVTLADYTPKPDLYAIRLASVDFGIGSMLYSDTYHDGCDAGGDGCGPEVAAQITQTFSMPTSEALIDEWPGHAGTTQNNDYGASGDPPILNAWLKRDTSLGPQHYPGDPGITMFTLSELETLTWDIDGHFRHLEHESTADFQLWTWYWRPTATNFMCVT
jgi:hypothetical protein